MSKKSNIKYVVGDATAPQGESKKIICHICNDIGAWGAGFVLALSKKWRYPEDYYRARQKYPLGDVDILSVESDVFVANMIAQHGVIGERVPFNPLSGKHSLDHQAEQQLTPPIRYDALKQALSKVNLVAEQIGATLHMPRIGCGLAGGKWEEVQKIIEEVVTVDVTVYDLA